MPTEKRVKGLTFEEWKARVARTMENFFGLHPDDIPDWDYWSAWDSGASPGIAAKEAMKAAKDF